LASIARKSPVLRALSGGAKNSTSDQSVTLFARQMIGC
jgi:hypothetical protein